MISIVIPATHSASTIDRIIAVVACKAGMRGKAAGVAITASRSFVVDTGILTTDAWMLQVKGCRDPGRCIVALITGHPGK